MIRFLILVLQVARIIGRHLERQGRLDEALRQVEATLGKVTSEMAAKAIAARDSVSLDPDELRNDPRNLDRFPVEDEAGKKDQ